MSGGRHAGSRPEIEGSLTTPSEPHELKLVREININTSKNKYIYIYIYIYIYPPPCPQGTRGVFLRRKLGTSFQLLITSCQLLNT